MSATPDYSIWRTGFAGVERAFDMFDRIAGKAVAIRAKGSEALGKLTPAPAPAAVEPVKELAAPVVAPKVPKQMMIGAAVAVVAVVALIVALFKRKG